MSGYSQYKAVLTLSLVLIVSGLLLTAFSLFSPLWQIAEMAEEQTRHEHGLWWDCVHSTGGQQLIPLTQLRDRHRGNSQPIHTHTCSYKFDLSTQDSIRQALESGDTAQKEILLHRFLPQHKAVLFFGVFTFLFGLIGIVIGVCSPCFPPNSLLYVVAIFMTTSCSVLADVIFLFAAQSAESRSVPGANTVYPNGLGLAAYLHMFSTLLFSLSLLCSIVAAYLLISCGESRGEGCCARKQEYAQAQTNTTWRTAGVIVRTCDKQNCKPFVVVSDESSE